MSSMQARRLSNQSSQSARTITENVMQLSAPSIVSSSSRDFDDGASLAEGKTEEQALETHEVIELQLFSERKVWIEEKIEFLQNLPPVEVFVGLEAVRESAEEVPGLPTRAQLEQWLVEHDAIERETHKFDSGELQKLRKFTKAATQRNLSPEDTDLIELTLTTLYSLDKLLHLLRDRSDNLDLLGIRLTWEEHRTAAWSDKRAIITDLQAFLITRARWSPSVYESGTTSGQTLRHRSSNASLASTVSDTSNLSNDAMSRSARFRLAEMISRDAAQFSGRILALRHGKITAAAKVLDKLIDHSRKPVPDELLDEQDKLEQKGVNDMEHLGKFAMDMVMQWRKADEIFVQTTKDLAAAEGLLEEIENATLHHPTSRQSLSFISRVEALNRRLVLRGNPSSPNSGFLCPVHPLFPDQSESNEALVRLLSSEVTTLVDFVKGVDEVANKYSGKYDEVKNVEILAKSARDLASQFEFTLDRLRNGISPSTGDGSPPNLTSEVCLEPTRHSDFLALLPSILAEVERIDASANVIIRGSRQALLKLDLLAIDTGFRDDALAAFQLLEKLRDQVQTTRDDITSRVDRLGDARKIWHAAHESLRDLTSVRHAVADAMEVVRWRRQTGHAKSPLTPESPSAAISPIISSEDAKSRLESIAAKVHDIDSSLSSISLTLEQPLHQWLSQISSALKCQLEEAGKATQLLGSIRKQSEALEAIRKEYNNLQLQIEDFQVRLDSTIRNVLSGAMAAESLASCETDMTASFRAIDTCVHGFIDGMPNRVPFVARAIPSSQTAILLKYSFVSEDMKHVVSQFQVDVQPPFKLTSLDDAVRMDSNTYAMRIAGELRKLHQKRDHFHFVRMAKDLDLILSTTVEGVNRACQDLAAMKSSLGACIERGDSIESLCSFTNEMEDLSRAHRPAIGKSLSSVRNLLCRLESSPVAHDDAMREVYLARSRNVDDVELKFNDWIRAFTALKSRFREAQRLETLRLQDERRQLDSMAAEVESALSSVFSGILNAEHTLTTFELALKKQVKSVEALDSLSTQVSEFCHGREDHFAHSLASVQNLIIRLEQALCQHGSPVDHNVLAKKLRLKEGEAKFSSWRGGATSLQSRILQARRVEMQRLESERAHISLIAQELGEALERGRQHVGLFERDIESWKASILHPRSNPLNFLQSLASQIEEFSPGHRSTTQQSLSTVRDLLVRLRNEPGYSITPEQHEAVVWETLYSDTARAAEETECRLKSCHEELSTLQADISKMRTVEEERIRSERDRLSLLTQELDAILSSTVNELHYANEWLESSQSSFNVIKGHHDPLPLLEPFLTSSRTFTQTHQATISASLTSLQGLLSSLDAAPGYQDESARVAIYFARKNAVEDVESKFDSWKDAIASLKQEAEEIQTTEIFRRQDLLSAEQRKMKEEQERLALLLLEFESQSRLSLDVIKNAEEELVHLQSSFPSGADNNVVNELSSFLKHVEEFSHLHTANISPLISSLRTLIIKLEPAADLRGTIAEDDSRLVKIKAVDDIELRFTTWKQGALSLVTRAVDRLQTETRQDSENADESTEAEPSLLKAGQPHSQEIQKSVSDDASDVFGFQVAPSSPPSQEMLDLQVQIFSLRKQLRAININEMARPSQSSIYYSHLPTEDQINAMESEFAIVQLEVEKLPTAIEYPSVDLELRSLQTEVNASGELLDRIRDLLAFSRSVQLCDWACSDLLEHVDSYPSPPQGSLSSSFATPVDLPAEDQLLARLNFTKNTVDHAMSTFAVVTDDPRAVSETQRVVQTWKELKEVAHDRINEQKSRPVSVISSSRSSCASVTSRHSSTPGKGKAKHYAALSLGGSREGKLPSRLLPGSKKVAPIAPSVSSRSSSRVSTAAPRRSISGPFGSTNLRVFSSTFASRQRTTSLNTQNDTAVTSTSNRSSSSRPRAQSILSKRRGSVTTVEGSSNPLTNRTPSAATWSRVPRESFHTPSKVSPPRQRTRPPKRLYVANPNNKLDVAVGDVVNQLPVHINVEFAADDWKDQSGKYWIGDQDPKLCFCRILRSQTVMVRVGGGWTELSKFLKDHFADEFLAPGDCMLPQLPRDEKWISSSTLLETSRNLETLPGSPRTPEPKPGHPILSLNPPGSRSPLQSNSSPGSPGLLPLQFMKRAADAPLFPITPSKAGPRPRTTTPQAPTFLQVATPFSTTLHSSSQPFNSNTPARASHWRP